MTQIILLLILMSGSVAGCALLGRKFEEILPITCSSIVAILFLAGILGVLKLGVYIVILGAVALWGVAFVGVFKKREWIKSMKRFLTPGCMVFVCLYFLLGVLSRDMMASEWDEFSHWADIVKVMVSIDDFGTNPDAGSLFASYTPGMALFQYFFQKVYLLVKPQELFSEWRMYFAYQIFFVSFIMPFFKNISFKEPLKILLLGITVWLGPMFIFTNVYSSIYIDAILGFIAGAAFATVFIEKEKDWLYDVYIYLSIAMLVLAKDAGLLFASFLMILYMIDIFYNRYKNHGKIVIQKREIIKIALSVFALAAPKLLWSHNIKVNGATVAFGNSIDVSELVRILLGREPENYRSSVLELYSIAFLSHKIEIGNIAIEIPYIALIIVLLGIAYLLYMRYKEQEPEEKTIRKITISTLALLTIVFVIGMCVSYMFKFSEAEALGLAGFSRYMKIIFHCLWIFILLVAVHFAVKGNHKKIRTEIFVFCIVMAIVPWTEVSLNVTRRTVENSIAERASYQILIDQIEEVTKNDTEVSNITVICQETQGYEHLLFRYALRPHSVDWAYSIGEPFYEGDGYTKEITVEEWQEQLQSKRDYVALYKINDYFITEFSSAFENSEEIMENGLYKVNKESGLLELCSMQ